MRTAVLDRLKDRFGAPGAGLYAAGLSLVVLAAAGLVGLGLGQPWLFPSLGPTVMLFFESPEQPSSHPVNALAGPSSASPWVGPCCRPSIWPTRRRHRSGG